MYKHFKTRLQDTWTFTLRCIVIYFNFTVLLLHPLTYTPHPRCPPSIYTDKNIYFPDLCSPSEVLTGLHKYCFLCVFIDCLFYGQIIVYLHLMLVKLGICFEMSFLQTHDPVCVIHTWCDEICQSGVLNKKIKTFGIECMLCMSNIVFIGYCGGTKCECECLFSCTSPTPCCFSK